MPIEFQNLEFSNLNIFIYCWFATADTKDAILVICVSSPHSFLKIMANLNINGKQHQIDLSDDTPLLWALRDHLGMTGTKFGCGMALCGACTVHLDGQPIRSCITPVSAAAGKRITTIEAMGEDSVGKRVQQAWTELGVPQCGYCQSGQIMSATALLKTTPHPTDAEIDSAMSGNICRCGTYTRIRAAIKQAAGKKG
ncbi:Isoquinoline 1-oxidoreductase alpha subunit [Herminiimonas arsenicoxydans]|uniref:Isoquinoline 1-oxidoreductase alpha subunit n=1 Tax=Herminiimonas arsenicoxydans TaxID=204773 RepID=A4G4B9_HERAR|nr:Isoquinoline 1-oxidoreductase alpha subunit [Herminiimonas arsenicoxydans]